MAEPAPFEIGFAKDIKIFNQDHILHIHGKPLEMATFITRLTKHLEETTGKEWIQVAVAKYMREELGYPITQPQLSRYLSLLTLEPHFITKIKESNLRFTVAVSLASLPANQRQEVLDIANEYERERIYMYDVDAVKQKHILTDEIIALLDHRDSFDKPYDADDETKPNTETLSRPSATTLEQKLNRIQVWYDKTPDPTEDEWTELVYQHLLKLGKILES